MYHYFEELLQERNLKPADISRECNIPASTLSDWKKGRCTPRTEKLIRIAKFLNTTVEYLMGAED